MAPAQKLGRNLLCPGAKGEKEGGKGGKVGGRRGEEKKEEAVESFWSVIHSHLPSRREKRIKSKCSRLACFCFSR